MPLRLKHLLNRIEVAAVLRLGASPVSAVARIEPVVVFTRGRRSGRVRSTVLAVHHEPGGTMLIVGGAGGQDRSPDWVENLRADPAADVEVGSQRLAVRAEELSGTARSEIWPTVVRQFPRVQRYQAATERMVPVFRLHLMSG